MNNSGDKIIKEQVGNMQVSYDKEAAWMRLQERLESKDEKKPYFKIVWAAAAMLLLATALWFAFPASEEQPIAKETPAVLPPVIVKAPAKESTPLAIIETNEPVTIHKAKEKKAKLIVRKDTTPIMNEPIPEPVIAKEEPLKAPEAPKVVPAPKPKMKTVHINEIAREQMLEERMRQSRYAVERSILSPNQQYEQSGFKLNLQNKEAELYGLEEEYRLLQN